jgi:hypothetical protein
VLINVNGIIGAAAGFSYDTAANALFAPTITADGHPETGVNALYAGIGGYTVLGSSVVVQLTSNVDGYSQINQQNINSGNLASGDYIITADNGTDSTYYLDIGLASSNHDDPDFFGDTSTANDGYFYITGADQAGPSGGVGNLILGSTNGVIKLFVGNTAQANVIATVESTGLTVNTGNLTLPRGGVVYETNIPFGGLSGNTIALAPSGGINADQQLLVYPTAGQDFNHLHLTSGNLYNTELFVGDDNLYVKLANTGNIVINSNDGTGNSAQWTFGIDGNLTLPLGSIVYETNIPDQSLSGSAIALKPIGGTTANQKLLIYPTANDGDHIHMTSGNLYATELFLGSDNLYVKLANTGNVVINSNDNAGASGQWTFDVNGVVSFPRDAAGNTDPILTITGGSNPQILSEDASLAGPANLTIASNFAIFSGSTGNTVSIFADDGKIIGTNNIQIWTNNANVGNQYNWTFGSNGNFTIPGQIITASNSKLDLVSLGANTAYLTTTADDSTALFMGVSGVELRANDYISITTNTDDTSYLWTFGADSTLTNPGPIQMAVYANTTVRDAAITSPQPGMMIYVTGTGMQVRGTTQWNTIAGSGT